MLVNKLTELSPEAQTGSGVWKRMVTRRPPEACGDLAAPPPSPTPAPQGVHSPRTQSRDMAEVRASRRRAAAPSFLSAGAAAAPAIRAAGLAAPHGPRGRQCSAAPSHPLHVSPSAGVLENCEYRPAGGVLGAAPRRHRWEKGAPGTHSLPPPRPTGIPASAGQNHPRRPASQPISSRPVHQPRPHTST